MVTDRKTRRAGASVLALAFVASLATGGVASARGAASPSPAASAPAPAASSASPETAASPSPGASASSAPDSGASPASSPAASDTSPASPTAPSPSETSAPPAVATPSSHLIVPPAGFTYVPGADDVGGLRIDGRFERTRGTAYSFVYAGYFASIRSNSLGSDVAVYAKIFTSGIGKKRSGVKTLRSGRKTLCHGRKGYFVEVSVPGAIPIELVSTFTLGAKHLYGAFYFHSLSQAADPAAVASVESLCPQE